MVAKLIHNLANTNQQNSKYYGQSPQCPSCQSPIETLPHILSYGSAGSVDSREKALVVLNTDLQSINTPIEVIDAINHGIQMWIGTQTDPQLQVHALTVGSLKGPDVLLTAAFTEQFKSIGWDHFLMGRLSRWWGLAVALYNKQPNATLYQTSWTAQTVKFLWKYTRSQWAYRNTVVHGATDQEMADKIKGKTIDKVKSLYTTFQSTPQFILPRHHYLFTTRTLDQRLRLDIDSLNCWVRSVEDAIQTLHHQEIQQRLHSTRFFAPFYAAGRARLNLPSIDSYDSDYSEHSHSDDESSTTTFTATTVLTTATTNSSTSTSSTTTHSTTIHDSENSSGTNAPPSSISWNIS